MAVESLSPEVPLKLEEKTRNKISLAFEYFKQGKTPLDLVSEGIMDPDEAEKLYTKYLQLQRLKGITKPTKTYAPSKKVELTLEEWKNVFRAYKEGSTPVDVVIDYGIDPEKAEYAYLKFLELSDRYITLSDHEWSLAFYFFEKGYTPMDLASRGVLSPQKADFAYKKYLEFKGLKIPESVAYEPIEKHYIVKEPTVSYPPTSLLEREVPDILVVLFFIASVLVDIEHITAAIAYVRSNTFGFNPLIMALSMFFGAKVGIITSMILMVLFCGLLMFLSAFYLKKVFQTYPLLIVCILELVFTISHALHL
jgi:hypothetical protein